MKLTLDNLTAQLQRGLAGAYLVSGDEPLRVGEATDQIRARARAGGFAEREVFFVERAGSIWEQIEQAAQSLSLFAPRRLIEVRLPTGKAGVAGGAVLQRLIAAAGDDLLLLIVTGRLDRDTQNAAWVRALQEHGVWLPVWPVEIGQLPQWLQARARIAKITLSEDAVAMLAERCEGNLLAAQQEIDKLALLATTGVTVGSCRSGCKQCRQRAFRCVPARRGRTRRGLRARSAHPRRAAGRGRRTTARALGAAARTALGRVVDTGSHGAPDRTCGTRRSHGQRSAAPGPLG